VLRYCENDSPQTPSLGSVSLRVSDTVLTCEEEKEQSMSNSTKNTYLFKLVTGERILFMRAASETERNLWISNIRAHISNATKAL